MQVLIVSILESPDHLITDVSNFKALIPETSYLIPLSSAHVLVHSLVFYLPQHIHEIAIPAMMFGALLT